VTFPGRGQAEPFADNRLQCRRAPPGHSLLFLLNRNGVPSVGGIVKLR
jgi:hypothetical protein